MFTTVTTVKLIAIFLHVTEEEQEEEEEEEEEEDILFCQTNILPNAILTVRSFEFAEWRMSCI